MAERFLVIRPDRLGDVILSTPALQALKDQRPHSFLTVMVKENVAPLIRGMSCVDQVIIYDPDKRHRGLRGWLQLLREIRRLKFDAAIMLKNRWSIGWAMLVAGIQRRVGPLGHPFSYLIFNRGLRQKRSRVEMHEADYNVQLTTALLDLDQPLKRYSTQIFVSDNSKKAARQTLNDWGWRAGQPLVVVHPGMGGSAKNWPQQKYTHLVQQLIEAQIKVVLSFGPMDQALQKEYADRFAKNKRQVLIYSGVGSSVGALAGVYYWASLVVAPSTGPLHIAVALDKPVVTFYPSILVQSEKRWGPYVQDQSKKTVFVPDESGLMESIPVEKVLKSVNKYIGLPLNS